MKGTQISVTKLKMNDCRSPGGIQVTGAPGGSELN